MALSSERCIPNSCLPEGDLLAKLNIWNVNWTLDEELCPCDVHFLEYLDENRIKGASIFHFGTGGHHIVGIRCAEAKGDNAVLGITASPQEHEAYERLIIERPEVGRTYKVLFGDIYQLDPRMLPEFDLVTLFHTGEFRSDQNDAYGALTDAEVARLLLGKLRPRGLLVFFAGSFAFDKAEAVIAELLRDRLIEAAGSYKSLRIYRKAAAS